MAQAPIHNSHRLTHHSAFIPAHTKTVTQIRKQSRWVNRMCNRS